MMQINIRPSSNVEPVIIGRMLSESEYIYARVKIRVIKCQCYIYKYKYI